jgi:hypothetical protein
MNLCGNVFIAGYVFVYFIKLDIKEMCECGEWIHVTQDRNQ